MKAELHESSNLYLMTKELAEVAKRYQANHEEGLQLNMHGNYGEDWDEIYVTAENINTGKKWQIVKVALTNLSKRERTQLNLQVEMYNDSTDKCAA